MPIDFEFKDAVYWIRFSGEIEGVLLLIYCGVIFPAFATIFPDLIAFRKTP